MAMTQSILQRFGASEALAKDLALVPDILELLKSDPEKLAKEYGKEIYVVASGYAKRTYAKEIYATLSQFGISDKVIFKAIRKYDNPLSIENPYDYIDLGASFFATDEMAKSLYEIKTFESRRIEEGILEVIRASEEGWQAPFGLTANFARDKREVESLGQ